MKETPLMFSTDNVLRIVKGIKTMTRRTRGLDEINQDPDRWEYMRTNNDGKALFWVVADDPEIDIENRSRLVKCPFGGVGDQIWVKETYYTFQCGGEAVLYKANLAWEKEERPAPADGWMSAMFMPKRFARLWLPLTEPPRPERLQDISDEDIFAEGLESAVAIGKDGWDSPIDWYKKQWDSLNKKRGYGWDKNPYVFVLTFGALGIGLK